MAEISFWGVHQMRIGLSHDRANLQSSGKPRILFVGEAVALSHVSRPAVLANWAREAGYDCHFACGSAFASIAHAEGFVPHELVTIQARDFYARLNACNFFYSVDELEEYTRAE